MFRWYQNSKVCYVYHDDVETRDIATKMPEMEDAFVKSQWFTRGWTLQELLAPLILAFYDRNWDRIGERDQVSHLISRATGIKPLELQPGNFSKARVARRMSWAAKRATKKVEDKAYSLLGIFNVNMPLLYGEGEKAFHRLQPEILQSSEDESIFAWKDGDSQLSTPLASSPACFATSYDVVGYPFTDRIEAYHMTNRGLAISAVVRQRHVRFMHFHYIVLNCKKGSQECPMVLYLSPAFHTTRANSRYFHRRFAQVDLEKWSFPSETTGDQTRIIIKHPSCADKEKFVPSAYPQIREHNHESNSSFK